MKYLLILLIAFCIYYYCFSDKNIENFSAVKKVSKSKAETVKNPGKKVVSKKTLSKSTKTPIDRVGSESPRGSSKVSSRGSAKGSAKSSKSARSAKSSKSARSARSPRSAKNRGSVQNLISKSSSLKEINSLLLKGNIDPFIFDYTTMSDINLAKFSAIKLVDLINILGKSAQASNTLNSLLGLDLGKNSFNVILTNANIEDSAKPDILNNLYTQLKSIAKINVTKEFTLEDIPRNVIIDANKVFPLGTTMNMCASSRGILKSLRDKRVIPFNDYMVYQRKILDECVLKAKNEPTDLPLVEINLSEISGIKNLSQVPIDKDVGLPVIKPLFDTYSEFVDAKIKAESEVANIIRSDNNTYNSMSSVYGVKRPNIT